MWQNLHLLLISWVIMLSWFRIKLKMYTTARGFQSRPNFQARGWPRTQETRSRVGWDRSASVLSATPWPPAGELCYFSSASPFSGSLRFLLSEADPALGPQTTLKDFLSRKICRWSFSQDWYNSTFKQFQPACLKYLHLFARSEGSCFGRDASFTPGVGAIFYIISLVFLEFYDEIDLSLQ